MPRCFLGVDPGKKGGLAVIRQDGCAVSIARFDGKTEEAIIELFQQIWIECGKLVVVYLEKVHSSPQMGVVSAFSFGQSYGFLRAALVSHGWRINDVSPQTWQKELDCRTGGNKNVSKAKAQKLYPVLAPWITHHTADALLLATYAERMYNRGCRK